MPSFPGLFQKVNNSQNLTSMFLDNNFLSANNISIFQNATKLMNEETIGKDIFFAAGALVGAMVLCLIAAGIYAVHQSCKYGPQQDGLGGSVVQENSLASQL